MATKLKWGIVLLLISGGINFADKAIIGLAAGPIMAEFHLSSSQWGLIGSAFFFLFSLSSVMVPIWASRIGGTQKVLGILALVWAGIQVLTIIPIRSFVYLLATRILLGAGEGPFYGLSVHLAAVWTPSGRRGVVFGVLTLGSALGPAILSPFLAFLIFSIGWRETFFLLGALGFLWCIAWRWSRSVLPDTPASTIKKKSSLRSLRTADGILTILAGFGGYWYLALLVAWMPQYFSQVRHLEVNSTLYLLAVSLPWLGGALMQLLMTSISDSLWRSTNNVRLSRVFPLTCSLILGAFLLALAIVVPTPFESILCLSLSPIGASFPLVAAILGEMVPDPEVRGKAQGIAVACYALAGIIAPAITGVIIQRAASPRNGFAVAFLLGAGTIAIIGFLFWSFVRPLPKKSETISEEIQSSLV